MEPTSLADDPGPAPADAYLDTIALLQEELGRLEAELRQRDEEALDAGPAPDDPPEVAGAIRQVDELAGQLAERDETIALLWEQLSAMEEAQAARAAEWDQLHRWVEALEERIGDADAPPADPDEGRREAQALRDQMEARRQAWEGQRLRLEEELAALRARLDEATRGAVPPDLSALEDENRRLRDECRRLALVEVEGEASGASGPGAEIEDLRRRLREAREELDAERLRRRPEPAEPRSGEAAGRPNGGDLPPHERIRAFREHLRELHASEEQERLERQQRQLSARIARLWQRSGNGR